MEGKHVKDLMEAYLEMYAPQEVDEAVKGESSDRRKALAAERRAGIKPLSTKEGEKYASHKISQMAYAKRAKMGEELDIFDIVLEFLQAEGYAETLEEAEWMMANVIDEEAIEIILGEEQLDEISQRTAIRAYAASKTGEFEGADSDRDIKRTDNLEKHIKRKFGDKAVKHAERAADAQTFGRKDKSGRSKKSPQPRIQKSDYRTTQDGKMHKQDQRELKTELRIKRDRRLRAKDNVNEAQVANRDPDKYEREQAKKSAPVRGERTPMPPRGDKRREDFEKWYAKNVR